MAEVLYTIPVNDGFDADSECPICSIYGKLESDALEYTLGSSYMEDDVRMMTDEKGFCAPHMRTLFEMKNRLGLSLILKTHIDRQIKAVDLLKKKGIKTKGLFKKNDESELEAFVRKTDGTCFVCDRIATMFDQYLGTTVRLYERDEEFRAKYLACKGFCGKHFGLLITKAREMLPAKKLDRFVEDTVKLYTDNLKRLSDDLEWFQNKFDYRFRDEPWKNSKDAVERAIVKTNGILPKTSQNT